MEVKPGYKQTEVGVIPEEWEAPPIGSLGTFGKGQGIRKDEASSGDLPCIRYGEIYTHHNDIIRAFNSRISPSVASTSRRLTKGDLLFAGSGETKAEIGKCVAFVGEEHAYAGGDIVILSPNKGDSHFLGYLFNAPIIAKQKASKGQGDAVVHISATALSAIKIPLPPLPEQRAIAAALSDVDGLLGGLDLLINKKRDLKQAAMQQLLTGQTRLPGFHGEWEAKRLGDFGRCLRGVSYKGDSDLSTHDTLQTKRLLRSNNVQSAIVVTDEVQFVDAARVSFHQILQQDDILICMANGSKALVGKAGIFMSGDGYEYTFGAFMGCFRSNSVEANPTFVFYLFLTARYRDYINNLLAGSSINNLKPSSIESLEFLTPSLQEQTAIAKVLKEMDSELAALEQRRVKTLALKQAMMQELLTGRIRLIPPEPAHA